MTIFKVRLYSSDLQKGKRSGYRCIYYVKTDTDIILVTIYAKSEQSDVSPARIRSIMIEMGL